MRLGYCVRWSNFGEYGDASIQESAVVGFLSFSAWTSSVGPMVWVPPPSSGALPALGLSSAPPLSPMHSDVPIKSFRQPQILDRLYLGIADRHASGFLIGLPLNL